jgi:hypothetical protein
MRITKRFSWHEHGGDFAENFLRKNFFSSLGLRFRKIRRDKLGKKPDGWILRGKQKIALSEIKLIQYSPKNNLKGVRWNTIDRTIQHAIAGAKPQLQNIKTTLPKIIFLIFDDPFAKARSVLDAVFGPWITVERGGKIIFNGPRGFHPTQKTAQDNIIFGNWLSAIFCYIPDTDGYKILLFQQQNPPVKIPDELMPTEAIQERWEYSETLVKKKK